MSALTQKTNWPLILTLWLAGMSAAMQFSQVSVTFATLQAHYGISESAMSWLLSITSLFGVVFAACAGLFIQRWGYKHILLMALFLGGALSLVESTLPPLRVMFALRVLEGISHLAIVVTAPTLMAAASAPRHRSLVMSLWGTFFGMAFALTNAFAPWWLARFEVSGLFFAHGALMLFMGVFFALKLDRNLIVTTPEPIHVRRMLQLHVEIYGKLRTALPSLMFMCYTTLFVALLTLLPQLGAPAPWVSVAMPLFTLAGAFVAGLIVQYRATPPQMVRAAFGLTLAAILLLIVANFAQMDLSVFKIAIFFGLGLQQGSIYGMIPYLTHQPLQQSQSIAAIAQLGNLGAIMGPPLLTFMWLAGGANLLLFTCAAIIGAGLLLMMFVFKHLPKETP